MRLLEQFGACDCHSHVYGPYANFPLSEQRTFVPPESPAEHLELVWKEFGLDRAVLVQGSANGKDHSALLAGLARSPRTRRGVALLDSDVSDCELAKLNNAGVCAVRFNWIHHLLANDKRPEQQRLAEATHILERVQRFGWHVELHIDIVDLELAARLTVPTGMPVVIDHMARIDVCAVDGTAQILSLLKAVDHYGYWVKVSGGDRLATHCNNLDAAINPMRQMLRAAPERCVWGLDWPHVNLAKKRSDSALADLLLTAAGDEQILERVLIHNPAALYGFDAAA